MQSTSLNFHIDDKQLNDLINTGSEEFLDLVELGRLVNVATIAFQHSLEGLAEGPGTHLDRVSMALAFYDCLLDRIMDKSEDISRKYGSRYYFQALGFMLHGTDKDVSRLGVVINVAPFKLITDSLAADVTARQFDIRGHRLIGELLSTANRLSRHSDFESAVKENLADAEVMLKQFIVGAVIFVAGLGEELGLKREGVLPADDDILEADIIN